MALAVAQFHRGCGVKRLCVCLHFRAPLGGLQENVLATVRAAVSAGYQVSVLCPAGPFLDDHVRLLGVNVLAVDFQSESSTAQARRVLCQADVIHAHPGPSRLLALEAARVSGAPVVFTIHGAWFDSVQHHAQHLAAIVCVSPAVQEAVTRLCPDHTPRILYIPNGVDVDRFRAVQGAAMEPGHVVVASRLDVDKRVLIDTLISLWEAQAKRGAVNALRYTVAGQGSLRGELESAAQRLGILARFAGWQAPDDLARLYGRAAAVIASGRAALEALAGGRPTLALASAGAAEAFEPAQLVAASYSNFGGYGAQPVQSLDTLFDRLCAAVARMDTSFASQAVAFVRMHHDNAAVNQRLLDLYERAACAGADIVGAS